MYKCLACGARHVVHSSICTHCFVSHTLLAIGERPQAAHDAEVELTNARELARAVWQHVELPGYPGIELRRGALALMFGASGAGKSTMMARALDGMQVPALILSVEEPGGPSLAERFARLGIKRETLLVASRASVDQLATIVRDRKIVALGIDSVQRSMFEARDLRHLLLTLPSLAVLIATSQINKIGDIRGSEELHHESDVVLAVEEMRWRVVKSRYQEIGAEGDVLSSEVQHAS